MKKNNNKIYLAVDNSNMKNGKIINFEDIEKIKNRISKKVKRIKKVTDKNDEVVEILVSELKEILCEECFFNLISYLKE
jgi:hypothetical protein